jgi:hypothetical protein
LLVSRQLFPGLPADERKEQLSDSVPLELERDRDARPLAAVDFTDLPYWDLWADLRLARRTADWSLDAAQRKAMREGHEAFVAQALARLMPDA